VKQALGQDCAAQMTLGVSDGEPYDTVSGHVTGVDPTQVWVVVFARTNQWYIQPFADSRAYLPVNPDGTYETWIRDWEQVVGFVIRKGYDALNSYQAHKPLPLHVDCVDVLAVAAYPTVQFAGYEWAVKAGDQLGPGPNDFSADSENVWVDAQGRLHLRITFRDGGWFCGEVYLLRSLGYGRCTYYLSSRVDLLDKNVVASPFLYQDDDRELDIEFSRWGLDLGPNAQFVVQPWNLPGHREQFTLMLAGEPSTHMIQWGPGQASFLSARGHDPNPPPGQILHAWAYTGADVPPESHEMRVHINLWLLQGQPPSDGQEAEMVIESFVYCPDGVEEDGDEDGYLNDACGGDDCDDSSPVIHPGVAEDCANGIDDDCDGFTDDVDPDCGPPYTSNAIVLAGGAHSVKGSGAVNTLALLLLPAGVLFILRRRRTKGPG
jgi:hypothetical protein